MVYLALSSGSDGSVAISRLDERGELVGQPRVVRNTELPATVAKLEGERPRWVWDDTRRWYAPLLAARVRVQRCVDLRLSHAILRRSELSAESELARARPNSWDESAAEEGEQTSSDALFEFEPPAESTREDPLEEFRMQRRAIGSAADPARLALLLAAESAGALVAAEIRCAGLPWRADLHEELLARHLGSRPPDGQRPSLLAAVLERVRIALDAPELNPDSPTELLKALAQAGILATSTRSWELKKIDHPAIPPLLEYKKLARLMSANGWHWLDENVSNGRFHPDYVPGGVVTGRWASTGGGGAL